jgi:hypothetical protein
MELNISERFHRLTESFFTIWEVFGKESFLSPIHHLRTGNEFVANLAPLVRYFTDDECFSLNFYSQHIKVIEFIDSVFSEHRSLLILAVDAVFLIIEEMTGEINETSKNIG